MKERTLCSVEAGEVPAHCDCVSIGHVRRDITIEGYPLTESFFVA